MTEYIVRMPPDMPYEIRAELNAWYVESEPIVRCRDCSNYTAGDDAYATDDWCAWWGGVCPSGDGFCAWAERREP